METFTGKPFYLPNEQFTQNPTQFAAMWVKQSFDKLSDYYYYKFVLQRYTFELSLLLDLKTDDFAIINFKMTEILNFMRINLNQFNGSVEFKFRYLADFYLSVSKVITNATFKAEI